MNNRAKTLQAAAIISDIIEGNGHDIQLEKIKLDEGGKIILYTLGGESLQIESILNVEKEFGDNNSTIFPEENESITIVIENKTHPELLLDGNRPQYTVKID